MASIIISRFNEDLSWLEHYKEKFNITIYNKEMNYQKLVAVI